MHLCIMLYTYLKSLALGAEVEVGAGGRAEAGAGAGAEAGAGVDMVIV